MDDEVDTLLIGVRADTAGFARDAAAMQATLQGSLGQGADSAGNLIERSLAKAVKSGQLGFDDLKKTALSALSEIAAHAVTGGVGAALGGSGSDGGLLALGGKLLGAAFGLPGRATGGPVSPGRAYTVGERGPELFVPTSAGAVVPAAAPAGARAVNVSITLAAPAGAEPRALAQSGRQVARAVSDALARAER
jgi:phage-related minor tail protein